MNIRPNIWYKCTGDSRYMRFRYPRFYFIIMRSISILSSGMIEAAATGPLRCARSFTVSPHHFVCRVYKLELYMVQHSGNPQAWYTIPVLFVFDTRGDMPRTPA
jgi:hypothetical protein